MKHLILVVVIVVFAVTNSRMISISYGNFTRQGLLYGIGNELVFQPLNNSQLNQLISRTKSNIQRYPGGTPSDYWLWNIGWVNKSELYLTSPEYQGLPSQWNKYLSLNSIGNTIIVLNQLHSNLSFQLSGLIAHSASGTQISFIELGNEMYDDTRADVMKIYPNPSDYGIKMSNWSFEIANEFPNSHIGLIGWGMSNISDKGYTSHREAVWNKDVLDNSSIIYPKQVDSVTVHLYYSLNFGINNNGTNAVKLLEQAFSNVKYDAQYWDKTISKDRFKNLWVTEMGTYGNNDLLYTWLKALYMGVLEMYIPFVSDRVKIILPYCIVCGDVNMPAFVLNNVTNEYDLTPVGILDTILVSKMRDSANMTVLTWNGVELYDNCLFGWKLTYGNGKLDKLGQTKVRGRKKDYNHSSNMNMNVKNENDIGQEKQSLIFINVNQIGYNVSFASIFWDEQFVESCNYQMESIFTDSIDVLLKKHATINDLSNHTVTFNSSNDEQLFIPPWSINVVELIC